MENSEWTSEDSEEEPAEEDVDQNQTEDDLFSAQTEVNQKKDPFVISVGPITRSRSKKLIEKIVCLIQNHESEEELLGQTNTIPTTFIYSADSYNS
ncbi:hypothetical protein Bca101_010231 [Brassica carinata]